MRVHCAHCAEFILTGCSIFAHNCVNKSCVVINGFYNSIIMTLNHSTCVCVYKFSIAHWWNWINEPKCIELTCFFAFFKESPHCIKLNNRNGSCGRLTWNYSIIPVTIYYICVACVHFFLKNKILSTFTRFKKKKKREQAQNAATSWTMFNSAHQSNFKSSDNIWDADGIVCM